MAEMGDGGFGSLLFGTPIGRFTLPERKPVADDSCRCGHDYSEHGVVPSVCGWREPQMADMVYGGPTGKGCDCTRFEFRYGTDKKRLEAAMKDIAAVTAAKNGDVSLQDLENVLVKYLTDTVKAEPLFPAVAADERAKVEALKQKVERAAAGVKFGLKPVLEGRAKLAMDEEV